MTFLARYTVRRVVFENSVNEKGISRGKRGFIVMCRLFIQLAYCQQCLIHMYLFYNILEAYSLRWNAVNIFI